MILVYKEAFWDVEKDMAAYLNKANGDPLLQDSYRRGRGKITSFP